MKLRKSRKVTQVETINFEGHWHYLKRIQSTYAINLALLTWNKYLHKTILQIQAKSLRMQKCFACQFDLKIHSHRIRPTLYIMSKERQINRTLATSFQKVIWIISGGLKIANFKINRSTNLFEVARKTQRLRKLCLTSEDYKVTLQKLSDDSTWDQVNRMF